MVRIIGSMKGPQNSNHAPYSDICSGEQRRIGQRSGRLKSYRLRYITTRKENEMEKITEH